MSISVAMTLASCAVPRSCAGGIFSDTPRQGSVDPGSHRTVRRLRRVEVDFGRIFPGGARPSATRAADRLTLNLFPDVCLIATRERATDLGPGRMQWQGRVPGTAGGQVVLIVDEAGPMVGTIRMDRDVYEVRYLGDGVHAIMDLDQSAFPRD